MTYLRRSNQGAARKNKQTIALIVVLLIALFAIQFFFPKFYPRIFYPIGQIFWKSTSGTVGWFTNVGKMAQSKYRLVKENKRLNDEIVARDAQSFLVDTLRSENEQLKAAFDRKGKGDDVLGVILSRPPIAPYDTLIIDAGSKDGITVGNKVYADGDVLIGDVAEVFGGTSKVSLFSTPGRTLSVMLVPSKGAGKNIEAIAVGRGGGNFMITLPVEAGVVKGDVILLPQIRPHTFGVVQKVESDSSDSLETVLFTLPRNLNELYFVQVDRSGN